MALSTAFGACGEDEETTTRTVTSSPFMQETAEGAPELPKPSTKADATALSGIDESIETYGHLATKEEEAQILTSLQSFMDAREAGDYPQACILLIDYMRDQLGGKSCPKSLSRTFSKTPPESLREASRIDTAAIKVDGKEAFVVYSTPGVKSQIMYVKEEEGEWKVGKVNADRLL